jgi:hypothetical protein
MWRQAAWHNFQNSGWAPLVYALACSCHHLRYFTPILPLRLYLALLNGCKLIVCCTDSLERQTRNAVRNHAAEPCFMNHSVEAAEYFNVICRFPYVPFLSKIGKSHVWQLTLGHDSNLSLSEHNARIYDSIKQVRFSYSVISTVGETKKYVNYSLKVCKIVVSLQEHYFRHAAGYAWYTGCFEFWLSFCYHIEILL